MAYSVPIPDTSDSLEARAAAQRIAREELLQKIRADGIPPSDADSADLRMWEQWDDHGYRTLWVEWP